MNVLLFGASGMIGSGVLIECLEDDGVREVVAVGRRPLGIDHPKLREVEVDDLLRIGDHADALGSPDACFYCVGVPSRGMSEEAYRRVTVDLTVAAADVLERRAPEIVFVFVSGQGTGPRGPMWARVKHEAEVDVLGRSFAAYVFRPGFIRAVHGAGPRTATYRVMYALLAPVAALLRHLVPSAVTDTATIGRAMLRVTREGHEPSVLETRDINAVGSAD